MREIQHKKGKVYYSMGEVSEMFDVKPSLIRFWEQKFDILKPHKNKKGNRMFTPQDVDNLALIYHLVKERGMTLAGAQMRIKQNKEGAQRDREIVDRLMAIRSLLMEIREELKEDGTAAVVMSSGADSLQEPEEEAGTVVAQEAEMSETVGTAGDVMQGEDPGTVSATEDAESHSQVPFEQPLLPDESFALAMQVTVEAPAVPEEEIENALPAQPQKEQPQIIEQTLF